MAARASLHLDEAADVVEPRPHHHRLDGDVGEREPAARRRTLFRGRVVRRRRRPDLPAAMRDVQLLPIDAAVGGVGPGECALIDAEAARGLRSDGKFVLAWSCTR